MARHVRLMEDGEFIIIWFRTCCSPNRWAYDAIESGELSRRRFGMTPLQYACRTCNEDLALKILEHPDECMMDLCYKGLTPLMICCLNDVKSIYREDGTRMNTVSKEMIKHPDKCGLRVQGSRGMTALMMFCHHESGHMGDAREIVMKLLETPELCGLDIVDDDGYNVLMYAIRNDWDDVALKILETPMICALDATDAHGDTSLIVACDHGSDDVALEMLKHVDKFNIAHINNGGETAADKAFRNDMTTTLVEMNRITDVIDLLHGSDDYSTMLRHLVNGCVERRLRDAPLTEDTKKRQVAMMEYVESQESLSESGECMGCCGGTKRIMVYVKCKHIVPVCKDCSVQMDSTCGGTCPVCRTETDVISDCFIYR